MRKSKEEREAEKTRKQQIRNLWQSAGVTDIRGFNNLVDEMKKVILEDMYEAEMDTHMQYGKSEKRPEESDNYRNGSYHKLVKTKDGKLELSVPLDRNGEFEPQVIKKHQSDITEIEDKIIGLYGCGMSTRDISENIQEIYGFGVSAETISSITNRVLISSIRLLKPLMSVTPADCHRFLICCFLAFSASLSSLLFLISVNSITFLLFYTVTSVYTLFFSVSSPE